MLQMCLLVYARGVEKGRKQALLYANPETSCCRHVHAQHERKQANKGIDIRQ